MAEYGGPRKELRKATDFHQAGAPKTREELRQELGLPDVDQILKDLQRTHGIRIGLSRNLVERFEAMKVESIGGYGATLISGCPTQDVCVFCDQNDWCATCDMMDWCSSVDTHFMPE